MKKKKDMLHAYLYAGLAILVAVAADQYTKYLAVMHLKIQEPISLIPGVFELHYLENTGAAFGMLQNRLSIFVIGAVAFSLLLLYFFGKFPVNKRFFPLRICMVLGCAGAIGNCIDRLEHRYVVDFFYFKLIDFPIFNIADIYVVLACILFLILTFFYYKENDFEIIFSKEKIN